MTTAGLQACRFIPKWSVGHSVVAGLLILLILGLSSIVKLELIVNGIFLGAIIALGAIGLSIIYGILNFAHLAQGDFMTLGAYIGLFLLGTMLPGLGMAGAGLGPFTFGYTIFIAIPLTVLLMAAIAIGLDVSVYRRLRRRGVGKVVMAMTSLGLAIGMRGIVQVIWGGDTYQYPRLSKDFYQLPMGVRIPPDNLFILAVVIILVVVLYLFLERTKVGKAMRATSDNMELARVSGINTENIIRWTWFLSAGLVATAGVLLAIFQAQLLPIMGWRFLILLFAAVILGGIGNIYGALVGAIIVGVAAEVSTQWMNPAYKIVIAFIIMIATLLLRPRGIFQVRQ